MNDSDLKHGDLVLVNNKNSGILFNLFLNMIRWGTHSDYTHVAIIVEYTKSCSYLINSLLKIKS